MRMLIALFLGLLVSVSSVARDHPDRLLVSALIPQYPVIAKTAHITGDVRTSFQVDSLGNVTDAPGNSQH